MTTHAAPEDQTAPADQTVHAEISALVHRLFRALDARNFAAGWMRDFVTDDVRMETPLGTTEGADVAGAAAEEALLRYDRTQHIASGIVVDVAPDADAGPERVTVSWNALMTHVHHEATLRALGAGADPLFVVGGFFEADVRRTPDGWRSSRVAVRPVWTKGLPPLGVQRDLQA
ncbi:nuclear transport factor 2 family protein [Streptomyces sp. R21]|uniref:Nuclear transport factor 2 family protein n=1 Tax=Streptomyces sp. R21 TaxID=3238627 RepID=A0AB39PEE2_9ACTN